MAHNRDPDYQKLKKINSCYLKAMRLAGDALCHDEEGKIELSIELYKRCLECIEECMEINIRGDAYLGPEWDDARGQQQKLLTLRGQATNRVTNLESCDIQPSQNLPSNNLPSYSESVPNGHTSMSDLSTDDFVPIKTDIELLTIPGGVQLFFVSADNRVASTPPSYPTILKVLVDRSECVYIQVNEWRYPLVAGQTPVFKTNAGAYLFPNHISQEITEGSIGIVISTEVDANLIETFECVLHNLALFRMQEQEDDVDISGVGENAVHLRDRVKVPISDQLAKNIGKGAELISYGIGEAAKYTTDAVKRGSQGLKERLVPNENPVPVSPAVQASFYYAHEASKATVKVSRFLIHSLCHVTRRVGEEIAPHVKEYSKKVLPSSVTAGEEDGQGESVVDGAVKVAGAGLSGLATVWNGLETSGIAIAEAVSKATVENVEFKYGKAAGTATSNAMGTCVNVGKTAFNLDNLGIKALAKRTAKDTGRAVLREYDMKYHKNTHGSEV